VKRAREWAAHASAERGELSAVDARALDEQGFTVLDGIVDAAWLERLRAGFESACAPGATASDRSETGTRHPAHLELRGADLERVLHDERILAAVRHVLQRPFRLLFCSGRDPLPGFGQQGLHTDWPLRAPGEPFAVVTALWPLDDFTAENGAPRVVPASHRVPRPLTKSMQSPQARHPHQQLVLARAGSVLVFNGHLVHGGTLNRSRGPRRALHVQWVALDRTPPHVSIDPPGEEHAP